MSIEAMKLALDALESRCGTNADERLAGGAIPALRTAIQQAEAQQPTEQDEQEADGLPPIVAGAIFDFAGFMTTRSEVIEVGSTAEAGPVADLVKEWAESRDLDLADAAVLSWQLHITRASLPATGEPVQADSSEHLRVIASLGDALRRLSFAAQTTGGTAGPDTELQSAIGQAEQALSLGGIWQAMSATPEPVAHLWQHGETGRTRIVMLGDVWTANDHWCYVGPLVLGSTHLAPSVPAAVARDAISTVREHYRGTDWGKAAESICDAIDAMLAAK